MQHHYISLLLLISVALSSSNVLPMLIDNPQQHSLGMDSHQYDNILSNKQFRNIINNIFYRTTDHTDDVPQRKTSIYVDTSRGIEKKSMSNKDGNYDGEGFRKEQWHNYPRQLDRLHDYVFGSWKDNPIKHPDPDDLYHSNIFPLSNRGVNHYEKDDSKSFFIHKMHLPQLENEFKTIDDLQDELPLENELKEIAFMQQDLREIQPFEDMNSVLKVKREGSNLLQSSSGNKKKRIFSLWSRLQSMSPKGHEIPHRRHIHAFYGLHNAEGSGTLTAEPRAFIRPPGSPLRWG